MDYYWGLFMSIPEILKIEISSILYNPGNIGKLNFSMFDYPGNSGNRSFPIFSYPGNIGKRVFSIFSYPENIWILDFSYLLTILKAFCNGSPGRRRGRESGAGDGGAIRGSGGGAPWRDGG